MQLPDAQGVTLEPWDIGLNQASKLKIFLPDSRAPRNPKGVFFTCSMSQHKPLGWLSPLATWLCNRQLWKLAALGTLFGRKDPEMPPESWLNTRISRSVMVIKYPCFSTIIWRRKRSGGFIWLVGNCGAFLLPTNLKHKALATSALCCVKITYVLGQTAALEQSPASGPFCSSLGKRAEFHVCRQTHMINFFLYSSTSAHSKPTTGHSVCHIIFSSRAVKSSAVTGDGSVP